MTRVLPVLTDAALRGRIHKIWNELADFDLADADACARQIDAGEPTVPHEAVAR